MLKVDTFDVDSLCNAVIEQSGEEQLALAALQLLYQHEHPDALFALAMWALDQEYGVQLSEDECVQALRRSAELGHAGAAFNLGLMHELGKQVEEDIEVAVEYYLLAAFRGHHKALLEISDLEGVVAKKLSIELITKIARQEHGRLIRIG